MFKFLRRFFKRAFTILVVAVISVVVGATFASGFGLMLVPPIGLLLWTTYAD